MDRRQSCAFNAVPAIRRKISNPLYFHYKPLLAVISGHSLLIARDSKYEFGMTGFLEACLQFCVRRLCNGCLNKKVELMSDRCHCQKT